VAGRRGEEVKKGASRLSPLFEPFARPLSQRPHRLCTFAGVPIRALLDFRALTLALTHLCALLALPIAPSSALPVAPLSLLLLLDALPLALLRAPTKAPPLLLPLTTSRCLVRLGRCRSRHRAAFLPNGPRRGPPDSETRLCGYQQPKSADPSACVRMGRRGGWGWDPGGGYPPTHTPPLGGWGVVGGWGGGGQL
jgi:hypothetical protein